jgi:hypothetical protein
MSKLKQRLVVVYMYKGPTDKKIKLERGGEHTWVGRLRRHTVRGFLLQYTKKSIRTGPQTKS